MTSSSKFGGDSRARDGCIVTYELPDGQIYVKQFSQLVHTSGGYARVVTVTGESRIKQAADWADAHDAKILSISTPDTILRDLDGTRATINDKKVAGGGIRRGTDQSPAERTDFPERAILGKIGRRDLFKEPGWPGAVDRDSDSIRRVRSPR